MHVLCVGDIRVHPRAGSTSVGYPESGNSQFSIKLPRDDHRAGVNICTIIILVPQLGQSQADGSGNGSVFCFSAVIVDNSFRHSSRHRVRKRFVRKPKKRIRTNPFGNTCRTNRRKNSVASSFISRHLPSRA